MFPSNRRDRRSVSQRVACWFVLATLGACAGSPGQPPAPPTTGIAAGIEEEALDPASTRFGGETISRNGLYRVRWTPRPSPLPLNEMFALDVSVERAGEPGVPPTDATLLVTAIMPAHAHGMRRFPQVTTRAAGQFEVTGMLLHMAGHWQLGLRCYGDDAPDEALFDIHVP